MRNLEDLAREHLGFPGRMIAGSKSRYRDKFPTHRVFFNAKVTIAGAKVWNGDLDLDDGKTLPILQRLADTTGSLVHVLAESYTPSGDEILSGAFFKDEAVEIRPNKEIGS